MKRRAPDKRKDDPDLGKAPENPHMPMFISKRPWYIGDNSNSLEHQRDSTKKTKLSEMNEWFSRGNEVYKTKTKTLYYRKGSCRNCGAMTHKQVDCLERPRKKSNQAWKTNETFGMDEKEQKKINLSYDGSRDRWNGYDTSTHMKTIETFNTSVKLANSQDENISKSEPKEEKNQNKNVIPNLRLREDTASYLQKTLAPVVEANADFVRKSDFLKEKKMVGCEIHLNSNPTEVDKLRREFLQNKLKLKLNRKEQLQKSYGLTKRKAPHEEQKEHSTPGYVGKETVGVLEKNHKQVWGSYFDKERMVWGFSCCFQTIRNSFCTGLKGKEAKRQEMKRKQEKLEQKEGPLNKTNIKVPKNLSRNESNVQNQTLSQRFSKSK